MAIIRNHVEVEKFNPKVTLPYELRHQDFQMAMQDVYDFFFDVNSHLTGKGLQRLDAMLRPAIVSGVLSDMLTASLANHSRALTENKYFNGHPDLIVQGTYAGNSVKAGGGWSRDQNHQESRWRGRYSRRSRTVDVCICLQCRC